MSIPRSFLDMSKKNSRLYLYIIIASFLLFAVSGYWNWKPSTAEYWPLLVSDGLTLISAIAAGIAATLLLSQFGPRDKPRLIWLFFAIGWWAWVVGEIFATGYDVFNLPYGDISVYDFFWTAGYLCFGLSLFFQIRNIYPSRRKSAIAFVPVVIFVLLATGGFTIWARAAGLGGDLSWFALYLALFYPVCDLVIGATALYLAFLFGRGAWGRPWWGLIVFAIADAINIFLWIGGDHLFSSSASSTLDIISSTIYNGGYLVAMLGFFFILFQNFWAAAPELDQRTQEMLKQYGTTH